MWPLLVVLALLAPQSDDPPPPPPTGPGTVLVTLADGSTIPLQSWTLSYEYVAWPKKAPADFAAPGSRFTTELWADKRLVPVAGSVITVTHPPDALTTTTTPAKKSKKAPPARLGSLLLVAGAVRVEVQAVGPEPAFLVPNGSGRVNVLARSLDLRGQTLTGGDRQYCLLSFSSSVDCGDAAHRVVKLEFSAPSP
jgi:hypothetical protein